MGTPYKVGDVFFAWIVHRNQLGAQVASSDITFRTRKPSGTAATASHSAATADDLTSINNANAGVLGWVDLVSTTGVYVARVTIDQSGEWWWRWQGTNPVVFADEGSFYVDVQRVVVA